MARFIALLAVLSLLAAACGGTEPQEQVEATPTAGATADPTLTDPPGPGTPPSVAATDPEPAEPEPTTPPSEDVPSTTVQLAAEGLQEGEHLVVLQTDDGPVEAGTYGGRNATLHLATLDPATVRSIDVHLGATADTPVVFSGDLGPDGATLEPALPVDLSGAAGQYILATPTNGGSSDERAGVWYVLIPRAPGLVLPVLPEGFTYEGWVEADGAVLTTGRFDDPATPDDFAGFSGDQGGPPLPGEDFLVSAPAGVTFPLDLAGARTFVTIEPDDDPDPGPSGLTLLAADIPPDAVDHTIYDMVPTLDTLPTIDVVLA